VILKQKVIINSPFNVIYWFSVFFYILKVVKLVWNIIYRLINISNASK